MTLIVDPPKEVRSCDRGFLGLELKVASQKELAKKEERGFYSPWRPGDLLGHKHPESCLLRAEHQQ